MRPWAGTQSSRSRPSGTGAGAAAVSTTDPSGRAVTRNPGAAAPGGSSATVSTGGTGRGSSASAATPAASASETAVATCHGHTRRGRAERAGRTGRASTSGSAGACNTAGSAASCGSGATAAAMRAHRRRRRRHRRNGPGQRRQPPLPRRDRRGQHRVLGGAAANRAHLRGIQRAEHILARQHLNLLGDVAGTTAHAAPSRHSRSDCSARRIQLHRAERHADALGHLAVRQAIHEGKQHQPAPIGLQAAKARPQRRGIAAARQQLQRIRRLVGRFGQIEIVRRHLPPPPARDIERAVTHQAEQPRLRAAARRLETAGITQTCRNASCTASAASGPCRVTRSATA